MPVDRKARHELAESLGLLVSGQMTNDQFDDRYYAEWLNSEDETVREIAEFGYSLYSSDVGTYRLRGWNAASQDAKQAAERAMLFLRSDREYNWPRSPANTVANLAAMPWINLGIPLLVVTLLFTILGCFIKDFPWGFMLLLWAAVVVIVAAAVFASRGRARSYEEWCKSGDIDAWPFLRRSELEATQTEVV
jgi:hypothetical protein